MSDVGRPNEALVKFVEEGIALRKSHSRTPAAEFLDQHGVPFFSYCSRFIRTRKTACCMPDEAG